jgi:hypothetical protein
MIRLPTVGADTGAWGTVLNDYLSVEHNVDGTQKTLAVVKGGTGATAAAGAQANLGLGTAATHAATDFLTPSGSGAALTGITVSQVSGAAPLASPTFSGTPAAPTPSTGDSSTAIATTAFVKAQSYLAATSDGSGLTHLRRPTNSQTGTSYTLVLTDAGKRVSLSNATAITLTVPPNSSVAFAVDDEIEITQDGAGQVTIAPGAGVTINSYGAKTKLAGQYAGASLKKTGTDTWLLIGNLA